MSFFGSGHDSRVKGFESRIGLLAQYGACFLPLPAASSSFELGNTFSTSSGLNAFAVNNILSFIILLNILEDNGLFFLLFFLSLLQGCSL